MNRIEQVFRECSKRKGIKEILLRKGLLSKIKQCDVEFSNVLQAFRVRSLFLNSCQSRYMHPCRLSWYWTSVSHQL